MTVPGAAPRRRHPRGRPDRGGRAHRRPRAAARDAARAARRRRAAHATPSACAARAEDALVGRGLHEIVGWSFTEPGLLDRLRLPAEHPHAPRRRRSRTRSRTDQSIMRPTLLGSLLDAARHNVARNGPDVAIFESGTVYRAAAERRRPLAGRRAPRARRAADRRASRRAPGGGERAEADFFAAKALLEALLERFARRLVGASRSSGRSCTPGAAPRCSPRRAARAVSSASSARCTRWWRRVGPRAHGGVRDRPRQARARPRPRSSPSAPSAPSPRCARTSP